MKQLTTALLLLTLFVTNANGQKVDSASKVAPQADNNTPLLSINDLNKVDSVLSEKINKFKLADYNQVVQLLQQLVNYRIREFSVGTNNAIKSSAKKP